MARVNTGKEHRVVDEGRTGRIIARRALRRSLGNPKKRQRDLAELLFEMYSKGVLQGKKLENLRITYATAGMDYGVGYEVEGTGVSAPESNAGPSDSASESVEEFTYPTGESESIPA